MKALILGDVHGNWDAADRTISTARYEHPDITHIFQVGDLGDGWPWKGKIERWDPQTSDRLPIHWCDGNHDNHDLLEQGDLNPRLIYQPRGSVLEIHGYRILWVGGATSIDRGRRKPHVSWWPQEGLSHGDVERALNVEGTIDAVISHDRPQSGPVPEGFNVLPDGEADRKGLQAILEHHQPRFWFHGHYHYALSGCVGNTEIYTCPAIGPTTSTPYREDYIIWDGIAAFPSW